MIKSYVMTAGVSPTSLQNLKQYQVGVKLPRPCYYGGFPSRVEALLRELVATGRPVLHLFSGRSDLGDVRVDLECPEATHKMSVEEYITSSDVERFAWVILDPPYAITEPRRLHDYACSASLSGNSLLRRAVSLFLRARADNVLWLDACCPRVFGFQRISVWTIIPSNCWQNVRVLTHLRRSGPEMAFSGLNTGANL